jgi:hypothetical protein
MIIYNPHNAAIMKERAGEAERILSQVPARHCFITGSFLNKDRYGDIDIFVITRSKKEIRVDNKTAKITVLDFNDLYSLFYHSISKSCIAKGILPTRPLKVTLSDYWQVINEAVPTIMNQKDKYHKDVRSLILYTEYFRSGEVLDTFQLDDRIMGFKDYRAVLGYIDKNVPSIIKGRAKGSYIKRFFYTQAGHYKGVLEYSAQKFLYALVHSITREASHG